MRQPGIGRFGVTQRAVNVRYTAPAVAFAAALDVCGKSMTDCRLSGNAGRTGRMEKIGRESIQGPCATMLRMDDDGRPDRRPVPNEPCIVQ